MSRRHSKSKRDSKNGLVGLFNVDFSMWQALRYLHEHYNLQPGPRDYVFKRLNDFHSDDVDFFLPQICTLVLSWPKEDAAASELERFLLDSCADSIHTALKVVWNLHAFLGYSENEVLNIRCEKLVHDCELAVVNSERPGILQKKRKEESERLKRVKENKERRSKGPKIKIKSSTSSSSSSGRSIRSSRSSPPPPPTAHHHHESKSESSDHTDLSEISTPSSSSCSSSSSSGTSPKENGTTVNVSAGASSPSSSDTSKVHNSDEVDDDSSSAGRDKVGKEEKERFLRKQRRCEYFTGENELIYLLEQVSQELGSLPKYQRNAQLSIWLQHINDNLPRGLYFPYPHSASEEHYGILRIVPNESFCLSSRDKVPFLLHLEIQYTEMDAGDPLISETLADGGLYPEASQKKKKSKRKKREKSEKKKSEKNVSSTIPTIIKSSIKHSDHSEKKVADDFEEKKIDENGVHENVNNNKEEDNEYMGWLLVDDEGDKDDGVNLMISPSRKNTHLPERDKNAKEAPGQKSGMNGTVKGSPDHLRPFGEPFAERKMRIQKMSRFGKLKNWELISVIFKGGDDLRQEHMAMQLIHLFHSIWKEAKLPLWLRPYDVLVTSESSGVIETVPDAVSIDHLKKNEGFESLLKFFEDTFGSRDTSDFKKAQRNFIESTAAYSLVTYFLQIKDRHNGNILLTNKGHVVHIDFGFLLSNSPGGNINFEAAPFKLPAEYVEVMGGEDSETFDLFKLLVIQGFLEARKHIEKFVLIVDIMMRGSPMPCFIGGPSTINAFRDRFFEGKDEQECIEFVYTGLIDESINNWRTTQYDIYQRVTNDIR